MANGDGGGSVGGDGGELTSLSLYFSPLHTRPEHLKLIFEIFHSQFIKRNAWDLD